ncbi:MAG: hypothetical protein EU532_05935 [Promethearchaeota archaeon]|nr:MAG: hypothetical protein EU532_05935 [Candidatus Lokiarchaeota archaeon]
MIKLSELSKEDKLFFFERSWVTLDGLWFLEIENETDWNTALKIDKIVWIRLLKTIIRRMQRYLKLDTLSPVNIIKILTLRWSIEGWEYKILKNGENEIDIGIITCPYKEAMNRNPERKDKISLICKNMCLPFYKEVIEDTNPNIRFDITKSQGLGDNHCNFKFTFKDKMPQKEEKLIKKVVTLEDRLFYFENHWFTMDGLWMVETENELGKKLALKIDIVVWQRLYQIIFRRLKRYLNIEDNSIKDLIKILEFAWSCEGYNYEIVKKEQTEAILNIKACPYKEMMDRNPERHERIEAICKDMCIPFYEPAIAEFNPKILLERKQFLGVGDSICDYHFKLK